MSKIYSLPSKELKDFLHQALEKWHSDLLRHGVKIGLICVASDDGEPALKGFAKHPAAAKVSVVSHKDRLVKKYDAEIEIDQYFYKDATDDELLSVFDHELTHLELQFKEGELKTDDLGRPVLKLIPDEFAVWGFYDVIRRHRGAAQETQAVDRLVHTLRERQLMLFDEPGTVSLLTKTA